jgi:hypothetical protein
VAQVGGDEVGVEQFRRVGRQQRPTSAGRCSRSSAAATPGSSSSARKNASWVTGKLCTGGLLLVAGDRIMPRRNRPHQPDFSDNPNCV